MSTTEAPTPQTLAADLRTAMQGEWSEERIDTVARSIEQITASCPARAAIGFGGVMVQIQNGKTFRSVPPGEPGPATLVGSVNTDDVNLLYAATTAFQFTTTPVYASVMFFDSNSKLLGYFIGGGVSVNPGIGGGRGSWS